MQLLAVLLAVVDYPAKEIHHELSLFGGLVDIEDGPVSSADGVRILAGGVGDRITEVFGDVLEGVVGSRSD